MGYIWYYSILSKMYNKTIICLPQLRQLTTSSNQLSVKKSHYKQGKILNKLITGSSNKKRKFFFDELQVPSSEGKLNLGHHLKNNKENSRRIAVLNSLFMRHISDLLANGNIGVDVMSKGLEISRVSMSSNFNQLNVFWGTNNESNIIELQNILPEVGHSLRHELIQLRVMGLVPRILFVKDKHYNSGANVDYLLRIADFGEDHRPCEIESDFNNDSSNILEKCQSEIREDGVDENKEVMPPMPQDTFNLNHELIMKKILKKMKKSRAIHRYEPNLAIKSDGSGAVCEDTVADKMTKEERKEALAKFILTRRIIQEKKRKNNLESYRAEYVLQEGIYEDDENENFEVEDYIEEEDYEEKIHKN